MRCAWLVAIVAVAIGYILVFDRWENVLVSTVGALVLGPLLRLAPSDEAGVAAVRAQAAKMAANSATAFFDGDETVRVRSATVATARGSLALVLLEPARLAAQKRPAVLFFHGGGLVLGHPSAEAASSAALARHTGRVWIVRRALSAEHEWAALTIERRMRSMRWLRVSPGLRRDWTAPMCCAMCGREPTSWALIASAWR